MARLSDVIEMFIKEMLKSTEEKQVEIKRNELANYFRCAPSQINYVLTTRFTLDKGYCVESKRGGGGFILIKMINYDNNKPDIKAMNEKIGTSLTYDAALKILDSLYDHGIIKQREKEIIKIVINDRILGSSKDKNKLRADIIKGVLTVIF